MRRGEGEKEEGGQRKVRRTIKRVSRSVALTAI
jgi:hypothetical protein